MNGGTTQNSRRSTAQLWLEQNKSVDAMSLRRGLSSETLVPAADGASRRKRTKFTPPPPKRAPLPTPSIGSLVLATASPKKPADEVRAKIGRCRLVAGIDVETNPWTCSETAAGLGQFGFYCFCPPAKLEARIVTIGWAFGELHSDPVRKERIVKPDGFRVEEAGARFHGVSHETAESDGLPLAKVLTELLDDMVAVRRAGGRVVAHHLELDAGIIARELERAGLGHRKDEWATFVREGLCLMDPAVGTWVRVCAGAQTAVERHRNTLKLCALVDALRPYRFWPPWVKNSAGDEARIHFAVFGALTELLRQGDL